MAQTVITPLTVKIDRSNDNLVQIRWSNEHGGTSQHTFKFNRALKNENKDVKYIIGNDFTKACNLKVLNASFQESITIGADNLTADQWFQLSKVTFAQMLESDKWINVIIEHSNNEVSVRDGNYSIELTIVKEPRNLQSY